MGTSVTAEQLPDHRIEYLAYEGPISKNRGEVSQWDAGSFEVKHRADGQLIVSLSGNKLQGEALLERLAEIAADGGQRWSVSLRNS